MAKYGNYIFKLHAERGHRRKRERQGGQSEQKAQRRDLYRRVWGSGSPATAETILRRCTVTAENKAGSVALRSSSLWPRGSD